MSRRCRKPLNIIVVGHWPIARTSPVQRVGQGFLQGNAAVYNTFNTQLRLVRDLTLHRYWAEAYRTWAAAPTAA